MDPDRQQLSHGGLLQVLVAEWEKQITRADGRAGYKKSLVLWVFEGSMVPRDRIELSTPALARLLPAS